MLKVSRKWLARVIYPGTLPRAAPARQAPNAVAANRPPASASPPVKHNARTVDYADAMAWFENRRPTYLRLCKAVEPYVEKDGVVFDVGANVGYFTKILGETLGLRGAVHLFEPVPHLAELCERTAERLPVETTVHPFGLSDEDATLEIFLSGSGNLGWNTIIAERTQQNMTSTQIEVREFAHAGVQDIPTLVKIDVEGAEYRVLHGMMGAIEQWAPRPTILCEIGWGSNHPDWPKELEAFDALAGLGYRATDLSGRPIDVRTIDRTTDVLFLPERAPDGRDESAPAD